MGIGMFWIYSLPTPTWQGRVEDAAGWNLVADACQRADLPASPKVWSRVSRWGGCSFFFFDLFANGLSSLCCAYIVHEPIFVCDAHKIYMECMYIYIYTCIHIPHYTTSCTDVYIHASYQRLLVKGDRRPWSMIPANPKCTSWTILRQVQHDFDQTTVHQFGCLKRLVRVWGEEVAHRFSS